ncbi:hypothetical protein OBBRIDRAFT_638946 [Obba rivulosa]|uniref:Uncharacterized protein n=1 Tax=Obba rivulosa TaxID=1052685 RepID=A0A8E2ASZ2_9APHY|nr:hypothetical protein OBBRIDRAFT_638946 [Obba rivulosa]
MRRLLNRRRTATSVGWENLTATEGEHPEIIELYVVVMGPSDLDKAKFIDEATGSTNRIRDPRHTCPISEAYTVPGNPDTTIYRLIHFPSFNFRVQSPVDTLSAISAACRTIGHDQVGGLIYLVNVKDVRAKKDRYCNFLFAREICAAASWVIATTGWNDSVGWNDEVGLDDAIRDITYGQPGDDVYFEEMSPGSQCLKHDGGRETAIGISQCVWKTPGSLRMRRELLEKPLSGTSAARLLQNIIVNRVAQLVKSICEARQRSQEAARRGDMEKLNRQIMKEAAERKRLEIPLSEIPKLWMTDEEAQSLLQPLPDPLPHNGPDGAPITVEILAWSRRSSWRRRMGLSRRAYLYCWRKCAGWVRKTTNCNLFGRHSLRPCVCCQRQRLPFKRLGA